MKRLSIYAVFGLVIILPFLLGLGIVKPPSFTPNGAPPSSVYLFKDIVGPLEPSIVPPPRPASWRDYASGGEGRLAILLTDPQSGWLGLAHGLKSIGVPFLITDDYRQALRHKVVFVYPMVSGKVLRTEALQALRRFMRQGGILLAQSVLGGGMEDLFGFAAVQENITSQSLHFSATAPSTRFLVDPHEKEARIGGTETPLQGGVGYTKPSAPPLATYDDGTAAITQNAAGTAFAIGPDIGYYLLMGYNNRQENIARHYVNDYEPTLDVFLRWIKGIYQAKNPDAVTLGTVPQGKSLSVLITHDVDYTRSMVNAVDYARFEKENGIAATYFIQTKYVRDWNDDVFFADQNLGYLRALQDMGMEIASHSVAHAKTFSRFALGDGKEAYPSYAPFVQSRFDTRNASVLGELRVSRFLLEKFVPDLRVASFRPGHLSNPYVLPQALEATGYGYSSSVTAGDSLTHLPFRLTYSRETGADTAIYEFPVTIEDEEDAPMIDRLPAAIRLTEKLKRYGGVFVLLIHPDILGQKLAFEKGFVAAMDASVWFGTMKQFGDWWRARDQVSVDVKRVKNLVTVTLDAPMALSDLSFAYPPEWRLVESDPALRLTVDKGQAVIERLSGKAVIKFRQK